MAIAPATPSTSTPTPIQSQGEPFDTLGSSTASDSTGREARAGRAASASCVGRADELPPPTTFNDGRLTRSEDSLASVEDFDRDRSAASTPEPGVLASAGGSRPPDRSPPVDGGRPAASVPAGSLRFPAPRRPWAWPSLDPDDGSSPPLAGSVTRKTAASTGPDNDRSAAPLISRSISCSGSANRSAPTAVCGPLTGGTRSRAMPSSLPAPSTRESQGSSLAPGPSLGGRASSEPPVMALIVPDRCTPANDETRRACRSARTSLSLGRCWTIPDGAVSRGSQPGS